MARKKKTEKTESRTRLIQGHYPFDVSEDEERREEKKEGGRTKKRRTDTFITPQATNCNK